MEDLLTFKVCKADYVITYKLVDYVGDIVMMENQNLEASIN